MARVHAVEVRYSSSIGFGHEVVVAAKGVAYSFDWSSDDHDEKEVREEVFSDHLDADRINYLGGDNEETQDTSLPVWLNTNLDMYTVLLARDYVALCTRPRQGYAVPAARPSHVGVRG